VTASRVEAIFDVRASASLTEPQRERLLSRFGPVVRAVAQDARGQARNRELALTRLEARLASGLAVRRTRTPTRPTRASQVRHAESKRRQSARKAQRRRPIDDG
jgi:ribosome-associated protein